jgi:hypothetical protein
MRCYEYLGRWGDFDEALGDLMIECETDLDDNVPTSHHRKVLWTVLSHWSRLDRRLWIGSIKSLLEDIGHYDKLFFAIRSIALEDNETASFLKEQGGILARILCDETATDEDIIKAIHEAREPTVYLGVQSDNDDLCTFLSACARLN